jgi:hypothetical protein
VRLITVFKMHCRLAVAFLAAILSLGSWPAQAQVDSGVILGTVTDPSGALIPNAKVSIKNEATDFTVTSATNERGEYEFSPVRIGTYTIVVVTPAFGQSSRLHVTVDIQQQVLVNFTLQPAAVTQTVEVTTTGEVLQTQEASVGQVVSGRAIQDLPLNGRNYTYLAQLGAGVTVAQYDYHGADNTGRFSANGASAMENNYLLDGMDNNSQINTRQSAHDYVVLSPVDAIAEFKIQTNNYSAQFGHSAGAVLNATIKSGTNQFHGDAWEFLRNDDLDGSDFFQNAAGAPIPEYRRNQFGFTQGGPVWLPHIYNGRNRTFFFLDYEGTRIRQGKTYVSTAPTQAERASGYTNFQDLISGQTGSRTDINNNSFPSGTIFDPATTRAVSGGYLRDPFPGNIIAPSRLDPNAISILQTLPAPNGPGILNNYTSAPIWQNNTNAFDARVDKIFSEHDQMFVRYSYSHLIRNQPGPYPGVADGGISGTANLDDRTQNAVIGETHSFGPSLVNEFRGGFNREAALFAQPYYAQLGIPAQFGIQGVPQFSGNGGLPLFNVGTLSHFGAYYFLPSFKYGTVGQITDDLTLVHGSHTFKMGVVLQPVILSPTIQPPSGRGDLTFSGAFTSIPTKTDGTTAVAQFLLAPVGSTAFASGGADSVYYSNTLAQDVARRNLGAYFQDDWKVTPRLTLNLGVRWDYAGFPQDREGNNVNLIPTQGFTGGAYYIPKAKQDQLPAFFVAALAKDGVQVKGTDGPAVGTAPRTNFAPRFGFAYQATPRLVVRGGYGIFFATFEETGATLTQNAYPFENAITASAQTPVSWITPNTAGNTIGPLETTLRDFSTSPLGVSPTSISPISFQYHWQTPYVQSDNLMIQYQLSSASSITVGYVGSLGRHLPQFAMPVNPTLQLLPPGTNATPYRAFPDLGIGGGSYITPVGSSSYNSLQISYEKRFSYGFSMLTNYTWQKTRTDTFDPSDNDQSKYRAPWLPGFGVPKDWFLADFNVPRMFHFSGTYELPFGTGKALGSGAHGVVGQLVSGWNMNWILTLQDGQPFTVGCPTATSAGGFGCNALRVPGQDMYAGPHNVNNFVNPLAFANPPGVTAIGQSSVAPLGGSPTQAAGPPFRRLDFSLFKQFKIGETFRLEFRAEAFNLTNTPSFLYPTTLNFLDTKSFGKITSTRDNPNDPREIQMGLKLYW